MPKEINFDKIYFDIEEAIKTLESGDGSISQNIELYKQTLKKINEAKKILQSAENEIKEITLENVR